MATLTKLFHVFYNRVPNSTYIFPDGTYANFTGGRYATDDEAKAEHLRQVAAQGNQHIYLDPEKMQLSEEQLDPMAELKARWQEEFLQKLATDKANDMGSSTQGKLNVADTNSVGEGAASSDSGAPGLPVGGAIKISLPTSK